MALKGEKYDCIRLSYSIIYFNTMATLRHPPKLDAIPDFQSSLDDLIKHILSQMEEKMQGTSIVRTIHSLFSISKQ